MVISHNLTAMNAQRQFNITTNSKAKSSEKLSSGYKINRAADDAAGLAISEKMRRQIRGLNQASENIQDGISLVQIADGALHEDHDILQRINELAVQAANDTNTTEDRSAIQQEIDQLTVELDRIANSTSFNEHIYPLNHGPIDSKSEKIFPVHTIDLYNLPDGDYDGFNIHGHKLTITGDDNFEIVGNRVFLDHNNEFDISINSNATILVNDYDPVSYENETTFTVEAGKKAVLLTRYETSFSCDYKLNEDSELTIKANPEDSSDVQTLRFRDMTMGSNSTLNLEGIIFFSNGVLQKEDSAINTTINMYQGRFGGYPKLDLYGGYLDVDRVNLDVGEMFYNTSNAKYNSQESFVHVLEGRKTIENIQDYGDRVFHMLLAEANDEIWIQAGSEPDQDIMIQTVDARAKALGISKLSVMSHENAKKTIDTVKGALGKVSSYRSYFGAMQNRLEHAKRNVDNVAENTQASESIIRDTDMAKEMVQFSLKNILEQAGVSMMVQDNQTNQGVLSLLQ